jgi:hypothetical protein
MGRKSVASALALVVCMSAWMPVYQECGAQEFLFEWGQPGVGDGQFSSPSGIAVDSAGNVFVADTSNHRIQKFDREGAYLLKWGSAGSGAGQFNSPQGVAVDSADDVYVADSANHRIQKFGPGGGFIAAWGSNGAGPGQFDRPVGVVVDSQDDVYVTDSGNDRVQKFDRNGVFLASWGSSGAGPGQFQEPRSIAVLITGGDLSDSIYVGDGTHRIQMFGPGGGYVREFGGDGQADGLFDGLNGMGFTAGLLVVADSGNARIQKFFYDGGFIEKWGIFGWETGRFNRPAGIAGTEDVVYVVDAGNNRIQAFAEPLPPVVDLDRSLSYTLSWTNTHTVDSSGLGCVPPADTTQNVVWSSRHAIMFSGKVYSGYASDTSLILTATYAAGGRTVSEQLDLVFQSTSRAAGTVHVVEVDDAGNSCETAGDAVLTGTTPAGAPPVTPVENGGFELKGLGGGGCFITALLR